MSYETNVWSCCRTPFFISIDVYLNSADQRKLTEIRYLKSSKMESAQQNNAKELHIPTRKSYCHSWKETIIVVCNQGKKMQLKQ